MMLGQGVSFSTAALVADSLSWPISPALLVGFLPAFRHQQTGEVRLCQFVDGRVASMHLLDSLPADWVAVRDGRGRPTVLIAAIEAGYLRGDAFWTLGDLMHPGLDG